VDQGKLQRNMLAAINVYINHVEGAAGLGGPIHLVTPPVPEDVRLKKDDTIAKMLRAKGNTKKELMRAHPEIAAEFDKVQRVMAAHQVKTWGGQPVPTNYIFMLSCCHRPDCPHPLCQQPMPAEMPRWYPGGPPVTFIPFPVEDETRISIFARGCFITLTVNHSIPTGY